MMQKVTLNNGVAMPIPGLGVYQVPGPKECEQSVFNAIALSYRLMDLIVHNEIVPAVNQAETHPYWQ